MSTNPTNNTKQEFDPNQWATITAKTSDSDEAARQDVIAVIEQLEQRGIDITQDYKHWVNIGFALAQQFGEEGRGLFHRVSCMNAGYDHAEAERKYTNCLQKGSGAVGYQTVLHYAREAGIDLGQIARNRQFEEMQEVAKSATSATPPLMPKSQNTVNNTIFSTFGDKMTSGEVAKVAEFGSSTYTFSDKIEPDDLPTFFRPMLDLYTAPHDRDKMLLSVIDVLSGLFPPQYYGLYDRRKVFTPLFTIVHGNAGSGKGDCNVCRHLADPIKNEQRRRYEAEKDQYETAFGEWQERSKGKNKSEAGPAPKEPTLQTPFLPANSSVSAVYRQMDANGGCGIIFETEADTLSHILGTEYGDYSDLMRKAHHHETISMIRVTDKLNIEIENPRLAIFLTCTNGQLSSLFPSFENGLGSRFLFYALPEVETPVFRNVFAGGDESEEDVYKKMGQNFLSLYHALIERAERPIQFKMTAEQQQRFLTMFDDVLKEQFFMLGKGMQAFVLRLALQCFRYAMVLTALRHLSDWNREDGLFDDDDQALVCSDKDFRIATTIVSCLVNHTGRVYATLNKEGDDPFAASHVQLLPDERRLYSALPPTYSSKILEETAAALSISQRSAQRYNGNFCTKHQIAERTSYGQYRKRKTAEIKP